MLRTRPGNFLREHLNPKFTGLSLVIIAIIFTLDEPVLIDYRFKLRGQEDASSELVIITLDEIFASKYGYPAFVPRDYLAALIDSLSVYGAQVIALDYEIRVEDRQDSNYVKLQEAISRAGNVVLPSLRNPGDDYKALLTIPPPDLKKLALTGYAELLGEHPLYMKMYEDLNNSQIEPSLALATVVFFRQRKAASSAAAGSAIDWENALKELKYPGKGNDQIPINYFGKLGYNFVSTHLSEMILHPDDGEIFPGHNIVKDKLVLIGSTYTENSNADTFISPFGTVRGVEIHANIINTLLTENYLIQLGLRWLILLMSVGFCLSVYIGRKYSLRKATIFLASLFFLYAIVSFILFSFEQVLIPVALPIQAGLVGFLFTLIKSQFWTGKTEKRVIDSTARPDLSPKHVKLHIFISYSRIDSEIVDRLAGKFVETGYRIWLDREDIKGGNKWRQHVVTAIEDAEIFIIALSPNSVKSESVRKELDLADSIEKDIIPITIHATDITEAMKYQLAGLQIVDLSRDFESGFRELLKSLPQVDKIEMK